MAIKDTILATRMATGLDLSGIQQLKPHEDPTSLSNRWTAWLKRFERFVVAMDIKDTTRKRSLLLYLAGPEVEKIFETIQDNGEEKDYDVAAKTLTEYFSPKKNTMYEIHLFRKAQQRQGETIRRNKKDVGCRFYHNTLRT